MCEQTCILVLWYYFCMILESFNEIFLYFVIYHPRVLIRKYTKLSYSGTHKGKNKSVYYPPQQGVLCHSSISSFNSSYATQIPLL